ncbi:MAG: hypothetical protein JST01_00490 [Cyanobacteria bacterium SZAS TMP-1]|nr:hypothetical protein [Cyanobacteria bacterium SZAS TMP-1]
MKKVENYDITVCSFLEMVGRGLSSTEAKKLETYVAGEPQETNNRIMLLSYSASKRFKSPREQEKYIGHALWFIDNRPELPCLDMAVLTPSEKSYAPQFKAHWLKTLKKHQGNCDVLRNAGHSMIMVDRKFSEKCFKRLHLLDPENEEWLRELSHFYVLDTYDANPTIAKRSAKLALKNGRGALKLHARFPKQSYLEHYFVMTIEQLADIALEHNYFSDAAFLGEYAIEHAYIGTVLEKPARALLGHSISGRAEAETGNLKSALEHFAALFQYGDPERGYDAKLAATLLKLKQREAVLQYLESCTEAMSKRRRELSQLMKSKNPVGVRNRVSELESRLTYTNDLKMQVSQRKRVKFPSAM